MSPSFYSVYHTRCNNPHLLVSGQKACSELPLFPLPAAARWSLPAANSDAKIRQGRGSAARQGLFLKKVRHTPGAGNAQR
jgi:hypothetical protein